MAALPAIPTLAAGGLITNRGLAVVGERGPELLSLPSGAAVQPLSNGRPIVVHVNSVLDGKVIARSTVNVLEDGLARR